MIWKKQPRSQHAPNALPAAHLPAGVPASKSDEVSPPYGASLAVRRPVSAARDESWDGVEAGIEAALCRLREDDFIIVGVPPYGGFIQFVRSGGLLVGESVGWSSATVMSELGWQPSVDRSRPDMMWIDREPDREDPLTAPTAAAVTGATLRAAFGCESPGGVTIAVG